MDIHETDGFEKLNDIYAREVEKNEKIYDIYAHEAEKNEKIYDIYAREAEKNEMNNLFINRLFSLEMKLKLIRKRLEKEGELIVAIDGESMYPFVKSGNHVRVIKLNEVSIGKVVLFYTTDIFGNVNFVLHRIVKMEGQKIWTKGDNNSYIDEYIYAENILGEFSKIVS